MKKLPFRPLTLAALVMAAPAAMAQAAAPEAEGLQLRAIVGVEHDNNVLRVPEAAGPISDTAVQIGAGLRFDKKYSLQRVHADVEVNRYIYQDVSDLSYTTVNYDLGWDWQLTPRFHGVLSAERRQFRDVQTDPLFAANIVGRRTERTERLEGIYEVGAAWRALAGVSHTSADSTQPRSWDASPSIRYAHVGVGYEFRSGTSLTARLRRGDGEYRDPTFLPGTTDFRDTETELAMRWPITGKTTLDARIAHLKREHDVSPALDFSGMVGNATVAWEITGKTKLVAGYLRDMSGTGLVSGGKVTSDRWYIAPTWKATALTAVNFRYDHIKRDWNDIPFATVNFGRTETIQSTQLGVDWEARRKLLVGAYVRGERLKSSLNTGYRATVYGVTARAYF